jgi:hypothetical protein
MGAPEQIAQIVINEINAFLKRFVGLWPYCTNRIKVREVGFGDIH